LVFCFFFSLVLWSPPTSPTFHTHTRYANEREREKTGDRGSVWMRLKAFCSWFPSFLHRPFIQTWATHTHVEIIKKDGENKRPHIIHHRKRGKKRFLKATVLEWGRERERTWRTPFFIFELFSEGWKEGEKRREKNIFRHFIIHIRNLCVSIYFPREEEIWMRRERPHDSSPAWGSFWMENTKTAVTQVRFWNQTVHSPAAVPGPKGGKFE
jgi:hypothetical protein